MSPSPADLSPQVTPTRASVACKQRPDPQHLVTTVTLLLALGDLNIAAPLLAIVLMGALPLLFWFIAFALETRIESHDPPPPVTSHIASLPACHTYGRRVSCLYGLHDTAEQ